MAADGTQETSVATEESSASDWPAPTPEADVSSFDREATALEHTDASQTDAPERDPLMHRIASMTIDEKIGQLLIFGYETVEDAEAVIRDLKPGGVILFGRNIQSAQQTRSDISRLQAVAAESEGQPVPLLISIDQEGGRVSRLPAESGVFESARELGFKDDPSITLAFGKRTAAALLDLGFNLDYAPVLDIDSNPLNPVIGDRSFGETAEGVTRHGLAMLNGLEAGGVIACVKHFPGHGDTYVDSHLSLPVVSKSLAELEAFELLPFAAAIDAGASMVMVAHLLIASMDDRPASLSPVLVDGLLRGQMGYQGVVITDDLTMGAIVEHYSLNDAAILAIEAGCDLLPVCHGTDKLRETHSALVDAWRSGRLTEARIEQSVLRILQLKQKWLLADSRG